MSASLDIDSPIDKTSAGQNGLVTPSLTQEDLLRRFRAVRALSSGLAACLSAEDACVQSMPDCSPAKWHLAHTSWFFETFVLATTADNYKPFHPSFKFLFNSYYNSVGEQYSRPARGLLTRPTLQDILEYRAHVDQHVITALQKPQTVKLLNVIEVGLHHEQQHQELLLMDIKHLFSVNPLKPTFRALSATQTAAQQSTALNTPEQLNWVNFDGGVCEIGANPNEFCFDNETPRHKTYLGDYKLAERLVSNAEYLEFINDGGYEIPTLWLSDGWSTIKEHNWQAPLYWRRKNDSWSEFTLHGEQPLAPSAPVVHLSYYEADAFARWAGARLPTEAEWEHGVAISKVSAAFANPSTARAVEDFESQLLQPEGEQQQTGERLIQVFGSVWQWTASAYLPFPGYVTPPGAIGEYNGKFMSNQMVLKGSCCVTPPGHSRLSYRNFFYPHCRWQFSGLRLAK